MMKNLNMTTLVLLGGLILATAASAPGFAAELPAQEGRIWAPTGDTIGLENHATLGMVSWDPHGNQPKYAEDWQQNDNFIFNGLFGYNTYLNSGRHIVVRGFGETDGTTTATRFTLKTSKPNRCKVNLEFRNATNFYDVTSEMRASGFGAPPAPPAMDGLPALDWRMARVSFAYNLGKGFGLDLGFNRMCKKGDKGSLLRGDTGTSAPGTKVFDTKTNELLVGANYRDATLDLAAKGSFRQTDSDRAVGEHTYSDDQTYYNAGLAATYRFNGKTSLMGMVNTGKLETENTEAWNSGQYSPNGEAKTLNSRLAMITHLGAATTARLTAGLSTWNTDSQTDLASVVEQVTTRERTSTDVGLFVTNTSLEKTRLRLDYRFRATKLEETVALDNSDNQSIDQDRMSQRVNLRAGIRLGRKTTLKASGDWRHLKVDQANLWDTTSGDALFYAMGDRTQQRMGGKLALQTRPNNKIRLNVGLQTHSQSFERDDVEGVKTTSNATQGFLGLNYQANDRLTFVGTASYGLEKYEIEDGPVAAAGMQPMTYEGTTLRFAPGAIFQVMEKMQLEAHYEGVRFEDPGDAPEDGNKLNSDLNRILLRASYQATRKIQVTATYRRHEFDENRWDDYIMDLYSLSLSGKF